MTIAELAVAEQEMEAELAAKHAAERELHSAAFAKARATNPGLDGKL